MSDIRKNVINAMLAMQRYPWEQGVAAQALYECGEWDRMTLLALEAAHRQLPDGRLAMIGDPVCVGDPAACGEACLRAYEHTGDSVFREAAEGMLGYLMMFAPRTEDGVTYHNTVSFDARYSPYQFWSDGCFMTAPFLAVMGEFTEAAKQFGGYCSFLIDEQTGLFRHIYDVESGCFADDQLWATGNGWVLLACAKLVHEAVKQNQVVFAGDYVEAGKALLDAMLKFQNADGTFCNVMNDPGSFHDNASAMMVAAFIYKGISEAWLEDGYVEYANKAYDHATAAIDRYGVVRGVCGAPHFTGEGSSCEAQAFWLMMSAAREKLLESYL
jgi:rhamnogalacturonyl hydrolase YesR